MACRKSQRLIENLCFQYYGLGRSFLKVLQSFNTHGNLGIIHFSYFCVFHVLQCRLPICLVHRAPTISKRSSSCRQTKPKNNVYLQAVSKLRLRPFQTNVVSWAPQQRNLIFRNLSTKLPKNRRNARPLVLRFPQKARRDRLPSSAMGYRVVLEAVGKTCEGFGRIRRVSWEALGWFIMHGMSWDEFVSITVMLNIFKIAFKMHKTCLNRTLCNPLSKGAPRTDACMKLACSVHNDACPVILNGFLVKLTASDHSWLLVGSSCENTYLCHL